MKETSRSAIAIGLLVMLTAVAGAAYTWWRWERIAVVEGDVPLPPGTEVIRVNEPDEPGGARVYVAQNKRTVGDLQSFFSDELGRRGWREGTAIENLARFSSGQRRLRVVFHSEQTMTKFTLSVRPAR